MASLPSADQNHYPYEVFLSFRGEDTRFGFTDHLYKALCGRGIKTFRDDDELKKGEEISPALLKAVEESRVSIIVFSKNYASSRWCLDELVKILECRKSKGQEVRSVFYKVDPSDVRHQPPLTSFGEAFAKLQFRYKDSMDTWRTALKEAADLSGWTFKEASMTFFNPPPPPNLLVNLYESAFINKIVGELSARVVNPSQKLHVAEHPIGIESCRRAIDSCLDVEEESAVRMVGIWGIGGIGKTTIAKDVYNSMRHKFESSCFLADVRSNSSHHKGLARLQQTILCDILGDSTLKVRSVDIGLGFIKERMRGKKVLLILDDVSDSTQLKKLVPSSDCFGAGSRIIITTRDQRWLTAHRVDSIYEVNMLDDNRALELFSLNAFRANGPPDDYLKLAQRAVRYAQGLPLALIVLGSHLFDRSRDEWEDILDRCKGDPQREIQGVLRISYDALDDCAKELFLDIACFFKGDNVDDVRPMLQACGRNPTIGMKLLVEKALIRIDGDKIWMHDLIEEMGQGIVLQEGEPSERSRLWNREDVDHVLTDNTGTDKIKGIQVRWHWGHGGICLNGTSFSKMKNLIYFSSSKGVGYSGNIDYLSNNLRWLHWPGCPLQSFPSNFHPKELVALNIPYSSSITQLWEGRKICPNLTSMELMCCHSLMELPDVTGIPNLKKLILVDCSSLVKVHHSVGFLYRLENLYVDGCYKLDTFTRAFSLKSVRTISLINCERLEEFPKIVGKMDSLRKLHLSRTDIKDLHPSIGYLIGLEELSLCDCENFTTMPCNIYGLQNLRALSLSGCSKLVTFPTNTESLHDDNGDGSLSLPKLNVLIMKGCNLSDGDFLMSLDCIETLTELDLSGNSFVSLPACISKFVNLEKLHLRCCKRLREIPELPPNLVEVDVSYCESLDKFLNLAKVLEGKEPQGIKWIHLWNSCGKLELELILPNNEENSPFRVVFPGSTSEVPKWFDFWKDVISNATDHLKSCQFLIKMSENLKWEKIGLTICAVSEGVEPYSCDCEVSINGVCIHPFGGWISSTSDLVWLQYIPLPVERKAEVDQKGCFSPRPYFTCIVRFIHQSENNEYASNKGSWRHHRPN